MRFNAFIFSALCVSPLAWIDAVSAADSCKALADETVTDLSDCCSGTLPRNETVNFNLVEISCGQRPASTGAISRYKMNSALNCVSLILRGERALVASWDPVRKECWHTKAGDPPLTSAPGFLLMRYQEEMEQEDCTIRVKQVEDKCRQDMAAEQTKCDQDKAGDKAKCDQDKTTLENECNKKLEDQKQSSKQQCALKTECEKKLDDQRKESQDQLQQCRREGQSHLGNGAWPKNDAMTNKRLAATALAYSPSNPNQVVTVDFARNIDIHDVTTAQTTRLATMQSSDGVATSIAWHPDGQSVMVACYYGVVKLYTVGPPGTTSTIYTLLDEKKETKGTKVAFSPDGKTAVAGLEDGRVLLWDVTSRTRLPISAQDKHSAAVNGLTFSSKDGTLVTASSDKTIKFWTGGKVVQTHPLNVEVRSVAFSPSGVHLACGLQDSSIKILDAASQTQRRDLRAHASAVVDVAFSADGNALLSASEDRTVRVWSLIGDYAQTTDTDKKAQAIAVSPGGNSLAVLFDMRPVVFYAKP
ncbi:WD40 repeat-like protein [Aspergillus japonicus CBS 114.51]|nr:WD40 repeat-like protein [Aspergillus japonicus CBS 114.51]RAH76786.1 WD40 repeat-like protein [Aspergillus japonicus CBS 114.51]